MAGDYVVTLTSIPPRYGQLPEVLDSLASQAPRAPSRIFLNVFSPVPPSISRRFPASVEIVTVPRDLGPVTKVAYTATRLAKEDAMVLVCDDDALKPTNWAARLLSPPPVPNEVVSFASIVHGGYGYAFRSGTLANLQEFVLTLPVCAKNIDDDAITLFCILRKISLRKAFRGNPLSVSVPLKRSSPSLCQAKDRNGKPQRDRLRCELSAFVARQHGGMLFDLRPGAPRTRTLAAAQSRRRSLPPSSSCASG